MNWAMRLLLSLSVLTLILISGNAADYQDPPLTPKEREHWSFIPPKRVALSKVKDADWVRNPIDAFILAKLEAQDLKPSPEASREVLIRRLTFDLHGLPPTPTEIDAFLKDTDPNAYDKLVDRLLASPHYGERWGQHWFDVVRYAESNGYEADGTRPNAWRYRDYVIRSLNSDKPYDRFLTEQLAGDQLAAGADPRENPDLFIATGYLRCGPVHMVSGNVDEDENRQESLTEMVNNLGSGILGLTMGCCRCHDHKFDPLSLGDYYRLQAYFAGTYTKDYSLSTEAQTSAMTTRAEPIKKRIAAIRQQIEAIDSPARQEVRKLKLTMVDEATLKADAKEPKDRTAADKELLKAAGPTLKVQWDEVLAALKPEALLKRKPLVAELETLERDLFETATPEQAWGMHNVKSIPETNVLLRGDVKKRSTKVSPGLPRVTLPVSVEVGPTRLDLARKITEAKHPLTARVMMNRLWQGHFGRGIVRTANDFGTRGDAPTHLELLDWLAREFVSPTQGVNLDLEKPWTLKRMHRLMVTSATYRQASEPSARAKLIDSENKLLSHARRRRLEAEAIRDAMLTASGTLTRSQGGPSVYVPLEPEVYDLIFTEGEPIALWPVTSDVKQHSRRTIYLHSKRNVRIPLLETFDLPDTLNSCAIRGESTYAPQALILMNGPLTQELTMAMAKSLQAESTDPRSQIQSAYRRTLGRNPRTEEVAECTKFLQQNPLSELCKALMNTSEFVYIP
ncbi:MAG: DUF1549 and DUF1553 domain-containing protein [Fimbriiglobus sp.]